MNQPHSPLRPRLLSDVEACYSELIDLLGYQNSPNFFRSSDSGALYDAEYAVTVDHERYPFLGIKKLPSADEETVAKLHLRYWNKNDIPFSILVLPDEIRIYNNFTIRSNKLLYSSSRNQNLYDLSDFCNDALISNLTDRKLEKCLKRGERVDQRLLENLRTTILLLHKQGMGIKPAYGFLAQCIFVKYLEDRGIIDLSSETFRSIPARNFTELLDLCEFKLIGRLFEILKQKFQGDFFDLPAPVSPDQLEKIAHFFKGDLLDTEGNAQISLFAYDFSIIPIELISNIYETFFALDDEISRTEKARHDGAYYTPCYLAEFMVSSFFARSENQTPTVLDPACGSGVFLVSCYKKMVNARLRETKEIQADALKEILETRIYGIDKNEEALKIACFSLYVAMLDYLTPKNIYENQVQLPTLQRNLIPRNFLSPELIPELDGVAVDLIIGNPPWVSAEEDVIEKRVSRSSGVSDQQTAQLFILGALNYARENTEVSFLVPNSIFLNENASVFRQKLFHQFTVREIINLHWMKAILFKHAKAPCSILTLRAASAPCDYSFSYCSFRPNLLSAVLNQIVYDKEDVIPLKRSEVLRSDRIWYILTSGDQFDLQTISCMQEYPPLKHQMESCHLEYGRGFAVGRRTRHCPAFLEYRGGNLNGCFESYFIDYDRLPDITEAWYERPRKLSFYQFKNKLLVKRTSNMQTGRASSTQDVFIFSDDFHQLADTTGKQLDFILYLEALYNSRLFDYYCFHCTKSVVSIKPEISKENLLSFPVPPFSAEDETIRSIVRTVRELKALKARLRRKDGFFFPMDQALQEEAGSLTRQIDQQIFYLYGLSSVEQEVVNSTLELAAAPPSEAAPADIQHYQKQLCDILNRVFEGSGYRTVPRLFHSRSLFTIALFDVRGPEFAAPDLSEDGLLKRLVNLLGFSSLEQLEGPVIVKKRISGFTPSGFYFIKSKDRKNWSGMSAIRDASFVMQTAFSDAGKEESV